jgi:hypothetical protein
MFGRFLLAAATVLLLLSMSGRARAHKPSDAYLILDASESVLHFRIDLALRDLDPVIGLDENHDGNLAWSEVEARRAVLAAYVQSHLGLASDHGPCPLAAKPPLELVGHTDGTYAVLHFDAACAARPSSLRVEYGLFFDRDALHRGLLRITTGGTDTTTAIFSESTRVQMFNLVGAERTAGFWAAVREGIVHIAQGADHLLFVLALLLPSVIRRKEGAWEPVDSFRPALLDVARIVTAFTIAHSITLSLAALDVLRLPSRFVETSIALSVVAAALANLSATFVGERWLAAFALGLLHGFGFSAVLADLGLARGGLVKTLVGFNLGVEIGQLAFVSLVFPVAFALRRSRSYVPFVLRAGSIGIALVAISWAVERGFDVVLLAR